MKTVLATRIALAVLLGAAVLTAPAIAAESATDMKSRQQAERAACVSGKSGQMLSACLKEVDAAAAEVRRGTIDGGGAAPAQNALKRCEPLSGAERDACMARMQGQGTTSGAVKDGGILRQLTTTEPGSAAARSSTDAASPPSGTAVRDAAPASNSASAPTGAASSANRN